MDQQHLYAVTMPLQIYARLINEQVLVCTVNCEMSLTSDVSNEYVIDEIYLIKCLPEQLTYLLVKYDKMRVLTEIPFELDNARFDTKSLFTHRVGEHLDALNSGAFT